MAALARNTAKHLATAAIHFHEWQLFRGGGSRRALQRELEPIRQGLRDWLEEGARCSSPKAATLCGNLLKLEPALWTFLYKRGVEPTNNHGERLVRSGVLWRKIAFGCHSERGCRFVERILTVVGTLRLQKRPGKRRGSADIRVRFGFAVKLRREELGLTQEDLADKAQIHRTYLSDIERGARNVALVNINRLAVALSLSLSEFFQIVERS